MDTMMRTGTGGVRARIHMRAAAVPGRESTVGGRMRSSLLLAALAMLLAGGGPCRAQTTERQRIASRNAYPRFTMKLDTTFSPGIRSDVSGRTLPGAMDLASSFSTSLRFPGGFRMTLGFPWTVRLAGGAETLRPIMTRPGDPYASAGYEFGGGDWRIGFDAVVCAPVLPAKAPGRTAQERHAPMRGMGYGMEAGILRYLDPLSISLSLGVEHGGEVPEDPGDPRYPVSVKAGFSVLEAMNRTTAVHLGVHQRIDVPDFRTRPEPGTWLRYSADLTAAIHFRGASTLAGVGLSIGIDGRMRPASLFASVSKELTLPGSEP